MKKFLVCAALGASALVPTAAGAQAIPPAVIAVVDLGRATSQCNACKTATAALRSQQTAAENRAKALSTPLETEGKSIQAAVEALKGAQPDAALQARARAWETKRQSAAAELSRSRDQLQRNLEYVQKQVSDKLGPIYQQVMQRRGANILLEANSTIAASNTVDITNDILAALNSALPSIATTAPAQARQQQPQGR